ncbi:MAG TPA: cytochrome c oxidase assembly protein [Anaerolineales bacterium]|nr:cytochrome c oxidase assembly protein [Anaerolineales bacterium]
MIPSAPFVEWNWEPSILVGLALLLLGYGLALRTLHRGSPRRAERGDNRGRVALFTLGTLIVGMALISPLDELGDHFLFSAHMLQHLILLLLGPLLWVIGLPPDLAERASSNPAARRALAFLTQPASAAVFWSLAMWSWHWPRLFDGALQHERIHILEHLTFMAAGVVGWWPAFGPRPAGTETRAGLAPVLHLFAFSLSCTALAALLTLSPVVLYTAYAHAPMAFGFTPLADQQLGGLLMWLPGDMLVIGAAIHALARWFGASHERHPSLRTLAVEVK